MSAHADVGPPRWNGDPVVLLALALVAHLYARGLTRLWRHGVGRGVRVWQAAAFAAGVVALVAALVSPLDALADRLASAHMVLMNVAAPLLVLGSPSLVLLSGVPGPYQAALRAPAVHDLEHLTFFAVAVLFWRAALDPLGRRRMHPLAGVAYLFATSLHATALGVFMALAPRPWYPDYEARPAAWGLTVLDDQQLGGLIMWMPACLAYAGAEGGLMVAWVGTQEGDS